MEGGKVSVARLKTASTYQTPFRTESSAPDCCGLTYSLTGNRCIRAGIDAYDKLDRSFILHREAEEICGRKVGEESKSMVGLSYDVCRPMAALHVSLLNLRRELLECLNLWRELELLDIRLEIIHLALTSIPFVVLTSTSQSLAHLIVNPACA
jgi:hypothetical protein